MSERELGEAAGSEGVTTLSDVIGEKMVKIAKSIGVEAAANQEAKEGGNYGKLRWQTRWDSLKIPERIIRKLAKIASLDYIDGHKDGGGGLCLGISGTKVRKKALVVLGHIATHIGDGSMDASVEGRGASWLDVEGWRDNDEFELLWCAAIRLRRNVAALRLEDRLFERAMNGYDQEEYKNIGGEVRKVVIRKFDHNVGINILRGLGYIDRSSGVKRVGVRRGVSIGTASVGSSEDLVGSGVDTGGTVLFMNREVAFREMDPDEPISEDIKAKVAAKVAGKVAAKVAAKVKGAVPEKGLKVKGAEKGVE